MNHTASIWAVLGIVATNDAREIRRAYARRLKVTNPEDDAEGFRQLRAAYEHAMSLAAQVAQQAVQSVTAEPVPTGREPETAQVVQIAQVVEVAPADAAPEPEASGSARTQEGDEELRIAAALFLQLEVALRNPTPDPSIEMRQLETLLTSPTLRRLDIHQRAESALANMLAQCIPRSDHLLETTIRFFEWDKRAHESSLSTPARQLLTRLGDVQFLASLRKMKNEYTRAYDQLMSGQAPRFRWIKASLSADPPELKVLRKLSEGHQNLLAQVPPETLRWWQEFAGRPRISRGLLITGIVATALLFLASLGHYFNEGGTMAQCLLVLFGGLASTVGVVAFKLFAIDIPAMHMQERWRGRPPVTLALGWLPTSIVLLFAAVAARSGGWPAWCLLVLAALTWLWAAQVSGPSQPRAAGTDAFDARAAQIFLINAPMFFWLMMLLDSPLDFSKTTYLTIVLLLLASATARSLQTWMYRMLLGWQRRAMVASVGLLVVLSATAWVAAYGRFDDVKPWVIAVVIAVTLLRRASPFGLFIGHRLSMPVILVFGWGLASYLMQEFNLDPSPLEYPEARPVVAGALVFLGGAVYSLVREIIEAVRKRGEAHTPG